MLVDVCQWLPERPLSARALTDPGISLAMQNFRAAIDSQASLFAGDAPTVIAGNDTPAVCSCHADFLLRFRREDLAGQEALYVTLLEKLTELLKSAGAEWLTASLCLRPQPYGRSAQALALLIRLEARGASQEQASLRWCLGAAHLQQALLFSSRYLRQQIGP